MSLGKIALIIVGGVIGVIVLLAAIGSSVDKPEPMLTPSPEQSVEALAETPTPAAQVEGKQTPPPATPTATTPIKVPAAPTKATPAPTKEPTATKQSTVSENCSADTYNCTDFSSCSQAMAVFNACSTDVHRLDANDDGTPCD